MIRADRTLPTFLIAGAGKSGSTSLYHYLEKHPDVCMCRMKEPRFFTNARGRFDGGPPTGPSRSGTFGNGPDWYSDLFEHCGKRRARGEASMIYFFSEDTPGLVRRLIPDVRLVFILRAPVARAYAQYWGERRHGAVLPEFEEVVRRDGADASRYLGTSHYKVHLERFAACFPADQLHVECFEDLVQSPADVMARVFAHIGVSASLARPVPGDVHNRGGRPLFPLIPRLSRRLRRSWLRGVVPSAGRSLMRRLYGPMTRWNIDRAGYPKLDARLARRLVAQFEDDIDHVERLVGHRLDSWRNLAQGERC